jgi:hypothetical protein
MGTMLLSLRVSHQAEITSRTGDQMTDRQRISESGLHAELMLTPDGDRELEALGFVRVTVEATPRTLPDMTNQQTVEWLKKALVKMLSDSPEP